MDDYCNGYETAIPLQLSKVIMNEDAFESNCHHEKFGHRQLQKCFRANSASFWDHQALLSFFIFVPLSP